MADEPAARLTTDFWVRAGLWQCQRSGVPAYVRQHGDDHGGAVSLIVNMGPEACRVLAQTTAMDGTTGWLDVYGGVTSEAEAEAYIRRSKARDRDLWLIEIQSPDGWHPFDGPEL